MFGSFAFYLFAAGYGCFLGLAIILGLNQGLSR